MLSIPALKYLILLLLLFAFLPKHSFASSPKGSLEVSPVFEEVVLDQPGQTKQITFTYTNNSDQPITLELFPIDFRQADRTGTLTFIGAESGSFSYSLASFLSFESNTIQLDPREKKNFLVTIANRDDLSPGGHYAAVVARLTTENAPENDAQIAPSISSQILLRKVGGERFNLSLSELDFPRNPVNFSYPRGITALFRNEGNVHLVPFGIVEIKDIFGRVIHKGIINTSSLRVFPETRRYIPIDMQRLSWSLPLSLNTIEVKGDDSLKKVDYTYRDTFLYINPVFLGGLTLGIILVVVVKRNLIKKKSKKEK